MRGGAIPYLAWGTLLVVLLVINWVWTGDAIQVGTFGFAALATYATGAVFWASHRGAIHRGPPEPRSVTDVLPSASLSAVVVGLSAACILFGIAWSTFLLYFGGAVLLLALGRMALELRAERVTRQRAEPGRRR